MSHISASKVNVRRWHEAGGGGDYVPPADARIITSDGRSIPAHSAILATTSPVLDSLLGQSRRNPNSNRIIHILGVSYDAVLAFVELLYSKKLDAGEGGRRRGGGARAGAAGAGARWLKRRCEAALARKVSAANAMDVSKLAKQCDAPRLRHRCLKLVAAELAAVQETKERRLEEGEAEVFFQFVQI